MATPRWRKGTYLTQPSIIEKLLQHPERFDFAQAVRLLEQFALLQRRYGKRVAAELLGEDSTPSREAIQFTSNHQLSFHATELTKLKLITNTHNSEPLQQYQLTVAFMGLLGSQGVLPHHYSETVIHRLRLKDSTMKLFFDLFNHRTVSLFYKANQKYNLPFTYERHHQQEKPRHQWDLISQVLRSLTGMGTQHLDDRLAVYDDPILFYAGHFSRQARSASSLEQIISGHFEVDVSIEQFIGQWQDMMPDFQTRLPGLGQGGQNNSLGTNMILGDKCWQVQSKFRVHLQVKDYATFVTFAPSTLKMRAMQHLIRLYVGIELDFDIMIKIPKSQLPPMQLSQDGDTAPLLGWNTFVPKQLGSDGLVDDGLIDIAINGHESLVA